MRSSSLSLWPVFVFHPCLMYSIHMLRYDIYSVHIYISYTIRKYIDRNSLAHSETTLAYCSTTTIHTYILLVCSRRSFFSCVSLTPYPCMYMYVHISKSIWMYVRKSVCVCVCMFAVGTNTLDWLWQTNRKATIIAHIMWWS